MLEISNDREQQREEAMSSRQQNEGHPPDKSLQEIQVIKEAKKIEANNEKADKEITIFLHQKGLSEHFIEILIDTGPTDEHIRLLKTMDFMDDDIENLQLLWRNKLENGKSDDSINFTPDESCLSLDSLYLKKVLSEPLIKALREIVAKKPADPVEYLAHWLLHFKICEERSKRRKEEELELLLEREKLKIEEAEVKEFVPIEQKEEEEQGEDWNYANYDEL